MFNLSNEYLDFRNNYSSKLEIKNNEKKIILFENYFSELDIDILPNVNSNLIIVFLPSQQLNLAKLKIKFNIKNNSKLNIKIANLSNKNNNFEIIFNLDEEYAKVECYTSTILNKSVSKNLQIYTNHNNPKTYSNIICYMVLKNESKGFIRCVSNLKQGSKQAEAHQELRLLILDKKAQANSDPVLLIDENDIIASHANAIGMLDYDQLFYLLSRGLSKKQAEELIINGYFNPIFDKVIDNEFKNYLNEQLKGMI